MSTTTPTPSDAAMAAAADIGGVVTKSASPLDEYGDLKFKTVSAIVDVIDRHFAPLREELARLTVGIRDAQPLTLAPPKPLTGVLCGPWL